MFWFRKHEVFEDRQRFLKISVTLHHEHLFLFSTTLLSFLHFLSMSFSFTHFPLPLLCARLSLSSPLETLTSVHFSSVKEVLTEAQNNGFIYSRSNVFRDGITIFGGLYNNWSQSLFSDPISLKLEFFSHREFIDVVHFIEWLLCTSS